MAGTESQPDRVLATPELKVDEGTRTELKANSLSAACNRTSTRKFPQYSAGFSFANVSRDTAVSNLPRSGGQSVSQLCLSRFEGGELRRGQESANPPRSA